MANFNFRTFVMNENKVYLAKEIGDVLNSAQELSDEVNKIGTRNLVRYGQIIVNKARGILQGHWGNENRKYRDWETDRKSTRLNSSHSAKSRMPSSA